jgi:hypothetical protein
VITEDLFTEYPSILRERNDDDGASARGDLSTSTLTFNNNECVHGERDIKAA